ncbi:SMP-30/gluconolactonase/LRE family protein [Aliiruegeria haliotis]|uniref:SMP-30/gluconolactonase/LRE family protein n=1 Tax=Aliiruegeria haliotis TaxID=1280846 RepID=UPI0013049CDF|nr:SMP-30/gluconolactonase/LRE family protein [Aliiruegeria haliotis]
MNRKTPGPTVEVPSTGVQPGMQALTRGLAVVEMIASAERPPRFTTLLEKTGLPKGTLHRILQTLVDERYIQVDERDQSYRLAAKPFELAHRVWDQFDLRGAAAPELARLSNMTGEAVRLGVLDQSQVLYIDQLDVPQPVRVANGVGSRAALHASALGKAMAAHLGMRDRHQLIDAEQLSAFTGRTITTEEDLHQHLNIIKARGYAIAIEELYEGVAGVAAAILDHRSEPLGAIGIVGPAFRLDAERLHSLGREVIEAARRVSGNIGQLSMSISVNPRPLMTTSSAVNLAIPGEDFLAEGPHWSEAHQRLLWVDILAPSFCTGDPKSGERDCIALPELVGCAVPHAEGGYVVATETGVKLLDEAGGLSVICRPEADRPGNRFNDGKCDRRGRFWLGSLSIDTAPGQGNLWRIDPDGSATLMDSGLSVSNGMGWSPDDRVMYFADSAKREIYAYDFETESGAISNRRVFVTLPEDNGTPDGLAVDAEGGVWVACWDGWSINRYTPDGMVDRVIPLPVPRPTSCTFGGPDLTTLFITTARIRLSSQVLSDAPLSGSVLSVEAGVKGQAETFFGMT